MYGVPRSFNNYGVQHLCGLTVCQGHVEGRKCAVFGRELASFADKSS